MAVNKRTPTNDIQNSVKVFPGPYVGYVKSATDVNRMGRLAVFIPMLHGTYDEVNKDLESQTVTVSYCSPFGGQTPLSETTSGNREFANTQKSYGFWMVPPDIDTKVLVMFANGDVNNGFWMGCVYEDYMNHMTPGIASSKPDKFVGTSQEIDEYYIQRELSKVPVTEAQRKAETQNIRRYNTDAQNDVAYSVRPAHTPSTQTLIKQGLIKDEVRGTTTASARRETPSQVFGISTPGPIDFNGQQTPPRESINRHGKILSGENVAKVSHSRLGGHQFVMDDGTPAKNVNNKITEPIKDELIRLRTRSGAQLLLHNTEGLVYITNNEGTAWIEFTKDGKIDIYAQDSVSIHTEADMNFRAERDINLEAKRNVNIKAVGGTSGNTVKGRVHIDAVDNIEMKATDDIKLQAGTDFKLYAGSNGKIEVGTNIDFYAGTDFLVNTGNEIHMNTAGKVSAGHVGNTNVSSLRTFDNKGLTFVSPDDISKSIMKRIPTVEPYAEHENKRYDNTTYDMTDREKVDERKIQ